MDARYLRIYLNDHLAGATAAVALVDRMIEAEAGGERGPFLTRLKGEIAEDRETLEAVMAANGVSVQRPKLVVAWLAEKPGRLKFNGHLLRRSPLTPFVELEALAAGASGKELLWRTLRARAADEAAAARFDELIARAERQRAAIDEQRLALADGIFPAAQRG
jgi:hypothetical protein